MFGARREQQLAGGITLPTVIRRIRDEGGWTDDGLAERIGCHASTVWRWRHDRAVPGAYELKALLRSVAVEHQALVLSWLTQDLSWEHAPTIPSETDLNGDGRTDFADVQHGAVSATSQVAQTTAAIHQHVADGKIDAEEHQDALAKIDRAMNRMRELRSAVDEVAETTARRKIGGDRR